MTFDARKHSEFFHDLAAEGYHIFGRQRAKIPGFYPNAFPSFPAIDLVNLKPGHTITIRAFFALGKMPGARIDSGQISLEVEDVDLAAKKVFANILTELPATFPLAKGTTIELEADEVLVVEEE